MSAAIADTALSVVSAVTAVSVAIAVTSAVTVSAVTLLSAPSLSQRCAHRRLIAVGFLLCSASPRKKQMLINVMRMNGHITHFSTRPTHPPTGTCYPRLGNCCDPCQLPASCQFPHNVPENSTCRVEWARSSSSCEYTFDRCQNI